MVTQITLCLVSLTVLISLWKGAFGWIHYLDKSRIAGNPLFNLEETNRRKDVMITSLGFATLTLLGMFIAAEASYLSFGGAHKMFASLLWAFASNQVGALLGFLFAVPKTATEQNSDTNGKSPSVLSKANTSLEQISDWLTKIIVGVTLVQTKEIYTQFKIISTCFAKGLDGGASEGKIFASAILVFFPLVGFLGTYLITRLYLAEVINNADTAASRDIFDRIPSDMVDATRDSIRTQVAEAIKTDQQRIATLPTKEIRFSATAYKVAEELQPVAFSELHSWKEFAAWGSAQLTLGNVANAIRAYEQAVLQYPDDPALLYEFAAALDKGGQQERTISVLKDAVSKFPNIDDDKMADEQRKLKADIFNSLTFRYLYVGSAEACNAAIDYSTLFLKSAKGSNRAPVLINLACALGQKATAIAKDTPQFNNLCAQALAAAREAINLDSAWRARLRFLLDPQHPDKRDFPENANENDLEVFSENQEFRALVGLS